MVKFRTHESIACTRFNMYTCDVCGTRITTVDIDEGTTPFMLTCPKCAGHMYSALYPHGLIPLEVPDPTIEWYKPADEEIPSLGACEIEHVALGGLLHRPIPEHHRSTIMLAFRERRLHRAV